MRGQDDKDNSELETEDEDSHEKLLLNDRSSVPKFSNSPHRFISVPSHSSIYTEFYPPDLTKFNIEKCKVDNQQPICMTSAWRVISFFVVVFILPTLLISIPLYARYHMYHAKMLSFTDGDMRSFHGDVSSFWCRGQRVTSNGTFDAYLTKEVRRLKRQKRISDLSSDLFLTHDEVEEWGIHLIKGSSFTFSTCSRWPGGTLLVVQGEDNMRRCFYEEEKALEQINGAHKKIQKEAGTKGDAETAVKNHNGEIGGGEVFGGDEGLTDQDIIRQLYSSSRNGRDPPQLNETQLTLHTVNYTSSEGDSSTQMPTQAPNIGENPKKKSKLIKTNKKGKKKRKERKEKRQKDTVSEDASKKVVKRNAQSFSSSSSSTNLEKVSLNEKLFFNINDTMDVTTGNSSFSSSEEFLRQCSNTIISLDLSPYPNCSQRVSAASLNDTLTWKFRVNETDNYYFIFMSDNSIEANIISFRLLLERRLYDVSEHLDVCANKSECVFPFSFMKSEGIIVDFIEHYENVSKLEDLNNYELTAICQPRSMVYTIFILLVPFSIIMFAFR